MPRYPSGRRDKKGILDAGAGFMLWNSRMQKWQWVDKSRLLKVRKDKGKNPPIQPSPYAENVVPKKSYPCFKVPAKKACVLPLKSHNRKSPQKRGHKPSQCKATNISEQYRSDDCSVQSDTTSDSGDKKKGKIIVHNLDAVPGNPVEPLGPEADQTLDEILEGHDTMITIISSRQFQLQAAMTFWYRSPSALVTYILRINDDSVTVDLLPLITKSIKEKSWNGLTLSMGACFDLLPTLRKLLSSQFEDYIIAALDMLRTILRHWWKQFKALNQSTQRKASDFLRSQNGQGIFTVIVTMADKIEKLSKRPGNLGKKAQVVHHLLSQL